MLEQKEMDRREFLKVSAAMGATLVAGDLLGEGPGLAYASTKLAPVEKLVITVITDNYYDTLRWNLFPPDFRLVKRYMIGPGSSIHAEHGLSYFIETWVDGRSHSMIFDYGLDYEGVSKNLGLLKIDLGTIEAMGLSHGHFDHWGTLLSLLKNNKDKIKKGTPLFVGEEAFSQRFAKLPEGRYDPSGLLDLGQLKREEIEGLDLVKVVEVKEPTMAMPGTLLTGQIERVTEYEKGSPVLMIKRGDKMEQDLFMGEQSLIFNVKGKGLVVLSSCAHAGIVNTVKHAKKITGVEKVHAILGGFHLVGAPPEKVQNTVADIKAINPDYIVPMHCTGWEAITAFEREMPKQFILNTAGTRYIFTS